MGVTTKLEENQHVIICLGEIDIRYHLLNHGENYKETIDSMVKDFGDYLSSYGNRYNIHICSILPPVKKFEHPDIPFLGSDAERRDMTMYFNEKLKELSVQLNLGFFDLTPLYVNEENMLEVSKSDNIVHAIKTLELEEKIKQYFNL
jgi:lysophospholipase L1-like esterase